MIQMILRVFKLKLSDILTLNTLFTRLRDHGFEQVINIASRWPGILKLLLA